MWINNEIKANELPPFLIDKLKSISFSDFPRIPKITGEAFSSVFLGRKCLVRRHPWSIRSFELVFDEGVMCVKGMEPAFPSEIESYMQGRVPEYITHFLRIEAKFPHVYSYSEGMEEVTAFMNVRKKWIFNDTLPVPLPLVLLKHNRNAIAKVAELIEPHIVHDHLTDIIWNSIRCEDAGVLLYFIPNISTTRRFYSIPIKKDNSVSEMPYKEFLKALSAELEIHPFDYFRNVCVFLARLLCIGFVPVTDRSHWTGNILSNQNLLVKGKGKVFLDGDSLQTVSELSPLQFCKSICMTLKHLENLASSLIMPIYEQMSEVDRTRVTLPFTMVSGLARTHAQNTFFAELSREAKSMEEMNIEFPEIVSQLIRNQNGDMLIEHLLGAIFGEEQSGVTGDKEPFS